MYLRNIIKSILNEDDGKLNLDLDLDGDGKDDVYISKSKDEVSKSLKGDEKDNKDDDSGDDILDTKDEDSQNDLGDEKDNKDDDSGDDILDTKDEDKSNDDSEDFQSDEQKVQELFTDIGIPEKDYSVNNPSNKRLAKFKFVYSGIDIDNILTPIEKEIGVAEKDLFSRLPPESRDVYRSSVQELRDSYKKISEREKNIIIYNSGVVFYINNDNGNEDEIEDINVLKDAYKKLDKFLSKTFGEFWQDSDEAIKFVKNIKINFDDEIKIRARLISKDTFIDRKFDKTDILYSDTPKYLEGYLLSFKDDSTYVKSSLFQNLMVPYNNNGSKNVTTSILIGGKDESEENNDEDS